MATIYPAKIDTNTSLPDVLNLVSDINADCINRLKVAIIAIQKELGIKPSTIYTSVRNRLDSIELTIAGQNGYSSIVPIFAPTLTLIDGGNANDGYTRPTLSIMRDGYTSTNNALNSIANSYAVSVDKQIISIVVEILANRIDVNGDAAYFVIKGVWKRNGNNLITIVSNFNVETPAFVGSSSSWTCSLIVTSGDPPTINVIVTGETGKNIHWSIIRKITEATP